jgi:hypothetical protein
VARLGELAEVGPRSFVGSKRYQAAMIDKPWYQRGLLWSPNRSSCNSPAALATETAEPFPSPPTHLVSDPAIQATLQAMAGYIKVDTPFNVDRFEQLLFDHPNQPFVQSVVRGLREGFWPFEDGIWDLSDEGLLDNFTSELEDLSAVCAFRDKEISAGRWSGPLPTTELLYGMKASPMFVVWQNEKPSVITDHSASGLNDRIPRDEACVQYDNMRTFGQVLYNVRCLHPNRPIITWKSDVASTFLNLPAHPLWQLRQVVFVDGVPYIVRRLVFGNRASPRIWCSVSGLLCWIAIKKLEIDRTHVYMDDFFGWDFADNLTLFHGQLRPRRQVLLLVLWDHVLCPYENRKQSHGACLKIIGFWVDANRGLISLSPESVDDIMQQLQEFLKSPER